MIQCDAKIFLKCQQGDFPHAFGSDLSGKEFLYRSNKQIPWEFTPFSEAQNMLHLLGSVCALLGKLPAMKVP